MVKCLPYEREDLSTVALYVTPVLGEWRQVSLRSTAGLAESRSPRFKMRSGLKNKVDTALATLNSEQPDLLWVCLRVGSSTAKHRQRIDSGSCTSMLNYLL